MCLNVFNIRNPFFFSWVFGQKQWKCFLYWFPILPSQLQSSAARLPFWRWRRRLCHFLSPGVDCERFLCGSTLIIRHKGVWDYWINNNNNKKKNNKKNIFCTSSETWAVTWSARLPYWLQLRHICSVRCSKDAGSCSPPPPPPPHLPRNGSTRLIFTCSLTDVSAPERTSRFQTKNNRYNGSICQRNARAVLPFSLLRPTSDKLQRSDADLEKKTRVKTQTNECGRSPCAAAAQLAGTTWQIVVQLEPSHLVVMLRFRGGGWVVGGANVGWLGGGGSWGGTNATTPLSLVVYPPFGCVFCVVTSLTSTKCLSPPAYYSFPTPIHRRSVALSLLYQGHLHLSPQVCFCVSLCLWWRRCEFLPLFLFFVFVVVSHRCWMIKEKLVPRRLFRTNRPYLIITRNITLRIKFVCFLSSRAEPLPFETPAVEFCCWNVCIRLLSQCCCRRRCCFFSSQLFQYLAYILFFILFFTLCLALHYWEDRC